MSELRIQRFAGPDIHPFILDLAKLRITIFHDYPYLYEGDLDYEKKYLNTYVICPDSVLVVVFDDDKVVGASTAIPLKFETTEFKSPLIAAGFDINSIFYLGESVLLKSYRGNKIGERFFAEREAAALEQGCSITAFCAVDRPDDHAKRPQDYHPLDRFWQRLGYVKHPELKAYYSWKEIGDDEETTKSFSFWLKYIK
jgi:GNAT superfamily N-acetyltransferase